MLDVSGSWRSYAVFNGDQRVSKFYTNKHQALKAADRIERQSRQIKRPCLCCTKTFTSEGPHNRLCNDCRRLS